MHKSWSCLIVVTSICTCPFAFSFLSYATKFLLFFFHLTGTFLYSLSPLSSDPFCEQHVTSLMQEMFLPAQNSDNHPLQQYAALALSFPRCHLWTNKLLNTDRNIKADVSGSKSVSQKVFPSTVQS